MKQSTHAKETGTLRSRSCKNRKETIGSVGDMPAGHEAKAKAKRKVSKPNKVVPLGQHHTITRPVLQWERDELLDKLWKAQDQAETWKDVNKYVFTYTSKKTHTNAKNSHRNLMMAIFQDHITKLKKRLLSLDEQISPLHDER